MEPKNSNKKEGLVPEEEIKGSDADKAYDQDGNFGKANQELDADESGQIGSDADTDE